MKQATIITTNGQALPFSFGMAALSAFMDAEDLTLATLGALGEGMKLSTAINLMWYGFSDGHRREKLPFDLTREDVADLIDEDGELLQKCMDIFAASMPKYANADDEKKETRRMKART